MEDRESRSPETEFRAMDRHRERGREGESQSHALQGIARCWHNCVISGDVKPRPEQLNENTHYNMSRSTRMSFRTCNMPAASGTAIRIAWRHPEWWQVIPLTECNSGTIQKFPITNLDLILRFGSKIQLHQTITASSGVCFN